MLITYDCIRLALLASDLSYFDFHTGMLLRVPGHRPDLQSSRTHRDALMFVTLMSRLMCISV